MSDASINVGDIIEVTTERLAYGGDAIARHEGLAIFVSLAAPKERVRVRITERKRNFARGVIDQIMEPSLQRREAPCRYFGSCGGCQLQHLTYDAQLASKIGFVRDALERIGRIDWPYPITIRQSSEFGYRARAQVKVDRNARKLGYNRAGSSAVCDIASCPILVSELDSALHSLRSALSGADDDHALADLSKVDIAAGDSAVSFEPSVAGLPDGVLYRTVSDAVYKFAPSTFFQGNPGLLNDMIDEAIGEASGAFAIDVYSGVGLFTIQLARRFDRVVGIESDAEAARFARENIAANCATNVEFHNSVAESWLKRFLESQGEQPDLVLLNPPRSGAMEAVPHIVALKPSSIAYVSCDPTTLARDLRALLDSGYELSRVTALDLFPQTYHVETVAALRAADSSLQRSATHTRIKA